MTRFLSRIWNDPLCGTLNEETDRLFAYHHATKHTYQSVRLNAHFLDWKNQPNPFRIYEGAPGIVLPPDTGFPNIGMFETIAALDDDARKAGINDSKTLEEIQLDLRGSAVCFGTPWPSAHGKRFRVRGIATACASTLRQEIFTPRKHTSRCGASVTSMMVCIITARILTRSSCAVPAPQRSSLPGP